jgi:HSP20 family protein
MLTLWRPFNDLNRLSQELEQLYFRGEPNGHRADFTPSVDIEEKENSVLIHADLPGVNEKDIEVKVHEGTLLISGKRESAKEEQGEGKYYSERSYGSFCRTFSLGRNVDAEKIEASYKNGVLTVLLPKKEEVKPKQIPISTN